MEKIEVIAEKVEESFKQLYALLRMKMCIILDSV